MYYGMFIADVKQNLKLKKKTATNNHPPPPQKKEKQKSLTCRKQNCSVEIILLKNQLLKNN